MTDAEKRERVQAELAADPGRSDRAIARAAGVSVSLVGKVRRTLSATSPTLSPTLSANVDTGVHAVGDTLAAEVAGLIETVADLARRLDALEGRAAAQPMDAFATSAPPMDAKELSKRAYQQISKLLPMLRGAQRSLLRDRLRAWR